MQGSIEDAKQKKDRLLDLHIAGAITIAEFKERNDGLNDLLKEQESQLAAIRQEQANVGPRELDINAIRKELYGVLSFEGEIDSALVATILDKIIVKKESTKKGIHLDIYLKLGQKYEAIYSPRKSSAGINPPKNTMPKPQIRGRERLTFENCRTVALYCFRRNDNRTKSYIFFAKELQLTIFELNMPLFAAEFLCRI